MCSLSIIHLLHGESIATDSQRCLHTQHSWGMWTGTNYARMSLLFHLGLVLMSTESACHWTMPIDVKSTCSTGCQHYYMPATSIAIDSSKSSPISMLLNLFDAHHTNDEQSILNLKISHSVVVRDASFKLFSTGFKSCMDQFFSSNVLNYYAYLEIWGIGRCLMTQKQQMHVCKYYEMH